MILCRGTVRRYSQDVLRSSDLRHAFFPSAEPMKATEEEEEEEEEARVLTVQFGQKDMNEVYSKDKWPCMIMPLEDKMSLKRGAYPPARHEPLSKLSLASNT